MNLVADTIQGVNQDATHLGVVAFSYWLDINPTERILVG